MSRALAGTSPIGRRRRQGNQPAAEHDRVQPEVQPIKELFAQRGLHEVQAPTDLHVLVPVTDLTHRADEIRPLGSVVKVSVGSPSVASSLLTATLMR
ncbi:hypothetical protein ACIA98_35810 [Streptomyces sp. NPDC051366]|uniref:hypothetical protein n=1 Tax=Streptomyces sp. NPDC051366 TaxID=3365652 RepID=UPI003791F069